MSENRYQLLNDRQEASRIMLEGWQVGMWTALPGIIKEVQLSAMTCTVQPAIQAIVVDENGHQKAVELPLLLDVPIVFPQGGGFSMTFPLAVGDEVLVIFSSRCIDAWWQSGGVQQAMEARMHDLSDGFAIPGPFSQPRVPGSISTTDFEIRRLSAPFASIGLTVDGAINIYSDFQINVTAPDIRLNGPVTVVGTLACGALTAASIGTSGSGAASIGGALSAASVVAGGKDLATHVHSGVTAGGANTGPPV